ncbi:hypothetical protein BHM03_00045775, partial [Ensete ventricosum]
YIPVRPLTGTRNARYRAVPRLGLFPPHYHPKSVGHDRFRSSVADFWRSRPREKEEEGEEEEGEENGELESGAALPISILTGRFRSSVADFGRSQSREKEEEGEEEEGEEKGELGVWRCSPNLDLSPTGDFFSPRGEKERGNVRRCSWYNLVPLCTMCRYARYSLVRIIPIADRYADMEQFYLRAPLVAIEDSAIGDLYVELVTTFNLKRHSCSDLAVEEVICAAHIDENDDRLLFKKSSNFHLLRVGVVGQHVHCVVGRLGLFPHSFIFRAYVVDVVELDRNEIVGVDKQGIATVGSDEGYSRGQRCSYVAGEAVIKEEVRLWLRLRLLRRKAATTSRGSRKQMRLKGREGTEVAGGRSKGGRWGSSDGSGRRREERKVVADGDEGSSNDCCGRGERDE